MHRAAAFILLSFMLMQIDKLANVGAAQYDAAKEKLAQDISRCAHIHMPLATPSKSKQSAGPYAKGAMHLGGILHIAKLAMMTAG